jgi:hypothetical protein
LDVCCVKVNFPSRGSVGVSRSAGLWHFDWDTAVIVVDTRRDYGEPRLRVMGRLDGVLHAAVVTPRGGDLRVISFRRANRREVRLYGKKDEG